MKVVGEFNNISKQMRPELPKAGTIVKYQFNIGNRDFENPKKINYPPSFRIPTIDRIYDSGKNEFVDIGVAPVKAKDANGNETFRTKAFYLRGGQGLLALTIGKIEDDEMYEFLELCNRNGSNEKRDTSVPVLFTKIDNLKTAKENSRKRDVLTEALVFVKGMNEADMREFAAAKGWNEQEDYEILIDQVGEYARTFPKEFVDFQNDPAIKDKALIKYAITQNVIRHDVSTNKMHWSDTGATIAVLERQDGKTYIDAFADWLRTGGKKGDDVMSGIRRRVKDFIKEINTKPKPEEV